ncbi:MAG: FRG domain-containing protein [Nitrospirae bacterium]|nr:FRG domain-containing protein [Nitrospirota bacterium]MDA1304325.1 FRG domain-containing protein [Nitrospirota bacterium]
MPDTQEISVETWEQFLDQLKELDHKRQALKDRKGLYASPFIFRGQASSEWKLTTTLDRYFQKRFSLEDYFGLILKVEPEIYSFTQRTLDVPEYERFLQWLKDWKPLRLANFLGMEYMIYLRHHGFPSPLLDWTRSASLAAWFAFATISSGNAAVSVYAYIEYAGNAKSHYGSDPCITNLPSNVHAHKRHFLQQSEYTICTKHEDDTYYYACHQDLLFQSRKEAGQDLLWKINIPVNERLKALKYLNTVNINSFSLFGSEESLLATLALRELHEKYWDRLPDIPI